MGKVMAASFVERTQKTPVQRLPLRIRAIKKEGLQRLGV
jgi:hypothetical protein